MRLRAEGVTQTFVPLQPSELKFWRFRRLPGQQLEGFPKIFDGGGRGVTRAGLLAGAAIPCRSFANPAGLFEMIGHQAGKFGDALPTLVDQPGGHARMMLAPQLFEHALVSDIAQQLVFEGVFDRAGKG